MRYYNKLLYLFASRAYLQHPRLQRLFTDPKEAKLMRWYSKRNKPENDDENEETDKMLRHPSDAKQWEALDFEYPTFGNDPDRKSVV